MFEILVGANPVDVLELQYTTADGRDLSMGVHLNRCRQGPNEKKQL